MVVEEFLGEPRGQEMEKMYGVSAKRETYDEFYKPGVEKVGFRALFKAVPMSEEDVASFRKEARQNMLKEYKRRIELSQKEIERCEWHIKFGFYDSDEESGTLVIPEAKGKESHAQLTEEEVEYFQKEDERKEELDAILKAAADDPLYKKVLENKLGDI
tara:strand:- start:23 stop:499 length:477 start_codon:yes stop_codon:yes gene_type:complete